MKNKEQILDKIDKLKENISFCNKQMNLFSLSENNDGFNYYVKLSDIDNAKINILEWVLKED